MKIPQERKPSILRIANALFGANIDIGKQMLRDYVDETLGMACLADEAGIPLSRLRRMLAPKGQIRARELFASLVILQRHAHIELHVATK